MPSDEVRAIELLRDTPYGRLAMSRNAMPFVTVARHIVVDHTVLLGIHRGFDYHSACDGGVVAYEADNLNQRNGSPDVWSVQLVGLARCVRPTRGQRELFDVPSPTAADGEAFDPAYLRIEPRFVTVHWLTGAQPRPDAPTPADPTPAHPD